LAEPLSSSGAGICIVVCNKPFRLIENLDAILTASSARTLLFTRQLQLFAADLAAATFKLGGTARALNKQQVTAVILAVGMGIAGCTTLVAVSDHIVRNPFAPCARQTQMFLPTNFSGSPALSPCARTQ
jgi:hypothetical protein